MGFKMSFHFQNVVLFLMCFHFQKVKGFVNVVFPFSEKHNCKQKSVHSLQIGDHPFKTSACPRGGGVPMLGGEGF